MKLWLDDVRAMQENFNLWAKTADEAIAMLSEGSISFNHDLGDSGMRTGYDVAAWIEEEVILGRLNMPQWEIHSMNPIGRSRIAAAMQSAERNNLYA